MAGHPFEGMSRGSGGRSTREDNLNLLTPVPMGQNHGVLKGSYFATVIDPGGLDTPGIPRGIQSRTKVWRCETGSERDGFLASD